MKSTQVADPCTLILPIHTARAPPTILPATTLYTLYILHLRRIVYFALVKCVCVNTVYIFLNTCVCASRYMTRMHEMRGLPSELRTVLELIPASAHPMDVLKTGMHGVSEN
jgi:hypothetical protein